MSPCTPRTGPYPYDTLPTAPDQWHRDLRDTATQGQRGQEVCAAVVECSSQLVAPTSRLTANAGVFKRALALNSTRAKLLVARCHRRRRYYARGDCSRQLRWRCDLWWRDNLSSQNSEPFRNSPDTSTTDRDHFDDKNPNDHRQHHWHELHHPITQNLQRRSHVRSIACLPTETSTSTSHTTPDFMQSLLQQDSKHSAIEQTRTEPDSGTESDYQQYEKSNPENKDFIIDTSSLPEHEKPQKQSCASK